MWHDASVKDGHVIEITAWFFFLFWFSRCWVTRRWRVKTPKQIFAMLSKKGLYTAHLNEKNLSTNSSWGFEHVLHTMNYYWLCPDENFSPHFRATRWRCDHFSKKWPKWKSDTTFTHKKTSVTPTFWKWKFSQMNRFGLMNCLSSTNPSSVVWNNLSSITKTDNIGYFSHSVFITELGFLVENGFWSKM